MAGPGPYAGEGEHSVQVNPAAQTRCDCRFDCAESRPLTADELRTYWRLIEKLPALRGKCLRLLTGGQRIEQLVRLHLADVRADSIAIYDTEHRPRRGAHAHGADRQGRRARPAVVRARRRPRLLHNEGHQADFRHDLVGLGGPRRVGDAIDGLQLKHVRSGVETLLAANRISREIRGRVQSHGLTGIQARHYDGHDDMLEKRETLDVLARELTSGAPRTKDTKPRRRAGSASPQET